MDFKSLTDQALGVCVGALGEPVSYTPQGGSVVTVQGIFSNPFYEIVSPGGVPVLTRKPTLGIQLSSLPVEPKIGDAVTVRSVNYTVSDVNDDGQGGADLFLKLA